MPLSPRLTPSRSLRAQLSILLATLIALTVPAADPSEPAPPATFQWASAGPVLLPAAVDGEAWHSVKDPTIVRHRDNWHLFCTVRGTQRSHAIVYLRFADWPDAPTAERHVLPCHPGYFCAPQVFFFTPHDQWYLICQASDDAWSPKYQPAFSTTSRLDEPGSWTPLEPMFRDSPSSPERWLDFWVICDDRRAHLFYTSLDGKMWRCETAMERFPYGWSAPALALEGDVFEASHTYRLRGRNHYLTLIEAQNGHGWRYYKAYLADQLEGPWRPLAADRNQAFASLLNVTQPNPRWTDNVSHGELLRTGMDEHLEVDPGNLRFLIQGVLDVDREGKSYGQIPWRLGLLVPR